MIDWNRWNAGLKLVAGSHTNEGKQPEYVWASYGNPWLVPLVLLVIIYRIVISANYWRDAKPMNRILF